MKIKLLFFLLVILSIQVKVNAQTTLNYFNGYQLSTNIELYWETPNETNIDYYEILFSTDLCISYAILMPHVTGNGTTSSTSNYSFILNGPLIDLCYCFKLTAFDLSGTPYYLDTTIVCYSSSVTSIENLNTNQNINIFPNPTNSNNITIQTNGLNLNRATLYNSQGQLIISQNLTDQKTTIDISTIEKGIYLIRLTDPIGNNYVRKLTIE